MCCTPDKKKLISGSDDKRLKVWSMEQFTEIKIEDKTDETTGSNNHKL